MGKAILHQRQVNVNAISTYLVESGDTKNQPILFLHGYPENSKEFEKVMNILNHKYYVVAIDLPGIGKSEPILNYDKLSIANFIKDLLLVLKLSKIVIVGHDVGGMITYCFIKTFPDFVSKAVIICTAIPGVKPWEEVKRNPYIWHFAFYSVPELPEQLIEGKHQMLFEYFYSTLSYNKQRIKQEDKKIYVEAYKSSHSLKTSLGWYRTFPQDEKNNIQNTTLIDVPVLYLKGEKDFGDIDNYLKGFNESGIRNIIGKTVPNSAHFAPEENPEFVATSIDNFIDEK